AAPRRAQSERRTMGCTCWHPFDGWKPGGRPSRLRSPRRLGARLRMGGQVARKPPMTLDTHTAIRAYSDTPMDALILFSHGSVLCGAGQALDEHAARLRERGDFGIVEIGY